MAKATKRKRSGPKAGKPARKAVKPTRARAASKPKARARASAASTLEALARKIVRATSLPSFPLRELYTEDCVSEEATGDVARGIAGLEEKLVRWEQMQSGTRWNPRNVWCKGNTICIEWDAAVQLRDGRTVQLREIGVHEVKNGKIAAERFYYNPLQLAPPQ
jgi:ketosteroid isomerase-like protein